MKLPITAMRFRKFLLGFFLLLVLSPLMGGAAESSKAIYSSQQMSPTNKLNAESIVGFTLPHWGQVYRYIMSDRFDVVSFVDQNTSTSLFLFVSQKNEKRENFPSMLTQLEDRDKKDFPAGQRRLIWTRLVPVNKKEIALSIKEQKISAKEISIFDKYPGIYAEFELHERALTLLGFGGKFQMQEAIDFLNELMNSRLTPGLTAGGTGSELTVRKTVYPNGQPEWEESMNAQTGEGFRKNYFPSGKIQWDCQHINRVLDGPCKEFYDNGVLKAVTNYKNGKLEEVSRQYYPSGKLQYETSWKNGQKDGIETDYFESGKISGLWNMRNGKRQGLVKQYYANGNLKGEWNYLDGKQNGRSKEYDESGKLTGEWEFKEGTLVRVVYGDVDESAVKLYEKENKISELIENGDDKASVEALMNMIKEDPKHIRAYDVLGMILERSGNRDQAIEILSNAVSKQIIGTGLYLRLGQLYMNQDDFESALPVLKMTYWLSPGDPEVQEALMSCYNSLAWAAQEAGNRKRSIAYLEQSLNVRPTAWAINELFRMYLRERNYFRAWRTMVDGRNWSEAQEEAGLGPYYYRKMKLYEVPHEIKVSQNALRKGATWREFGILGWNYLQQGDFYQALQYFKLALNEKNNPKNDWLYPNLATTYFALGKVDLAVKTLAKTEDSWSRIKKATGYYLYIALYFFMNVLLLWMAYGVWRSKAKPHPDLFEKNPAQDLGIVSFSWMFLGLIALVLFTIPVLVGGKLSLARLQSYLIKLPHIQQVNALPELLFNLLFAIGLGSMILFLNRWGTWFRCIKNFYRLGNRETWKIAIHGFVLIAGCSSIYYALWRLLMGGSMEAHSMLILATKTKNFSQILLEFGLVAGIVPILEELYFRGFLQTIIRRVTSPGFAIMMSAASFAFWHFRFDLLILYFVHGIILARMREKSKSLAPSIACHFLINCSAFLFAIA